MLERQEPGVHPQSPVRSESRYHRELECSGQHRACFGDGCNCIHAIAGLKVLLPIFSDGLNSLSVIFPCRQKPLVSRFHSCWDDRWRATVQSPETFQWWSFRASRHWDRERLCSGFEMKRASLSRMKSSVAW